MKNDESTLIMKMNERLARLETFNDKVAEPLLIQMSEKLDDLVKRTEFNEQKKEVDNKLLALENAIKSLNEHNEKLDGNIFIKAIVTGEKKLVGLIVKYTGITIIIGTITFFILMQFINSIQQTKPQSKEIIKEVKETVK